MLVKIKNILKSVFLQKNKISQFIKNGHLIVGKNTHIGDINIDIRKPKKNKIYLTIGENSVINGNFVFETEAAEILIGSNTYIGGGLFVSAHKITIGDDVMFSWGCTVSDTNAHSIFWEERKNDVKQWKNGLDKMQYGHFKDWSHVVSKPVLIKNKCWIGFNSIILKGVVLDEECVVGAGSVVVNSFPKKHILGGNPAKTIKVLN